MMKHLGTAFLMTILLFGLAVPQPARAEGLMSELNDLSAQPGGEDQIDVTDYVVRYFKSGDSSFDAKRLAQRYGLMAVPLNLQAGSADIDDVYFGIKDLGWSEDSYRFELILMFKDKVLVSAEGSLTR